MGAGTNRALGSIAAELLRRRPWTIIQVRNQGFSWDKVKSHFERAIELAPDCLENYFSYAKFYLLARGKRARARATLEKVFDLPLGDEYPLTNALAKKKAEALYEAKFAKSG